MRAIVVAPYSCVLKLWPLEFGLRPSTALPLLLFHQVNIKNVAAVKVELYIIHLINTQCVFILQGGSDQNSLRTTGVASKLQGQPLGIDIMYLVLADRNMQVRFGLKVVWGS